MCEYEDRQFSRVFLEHFTLILNNTRDSINKITVRQKCNKKVCNQVTFVRRKLLAPSSSYTFMTFSPCNISPKLKTQRNQLNGSDISSGLRFCYFRILIKLKQVFLMKSILRFSLAEELSYGSRFNSPFYSLILPSNPNHSH